MYIWDLDKLKQPKFNLTISEDGLLPLCDLKHDDRITFGDRQEFINMVVGKKIMTKD